MTEADALIAALTLAPHPEGGHYRETWRADAPSGARPAGTAILFLLKAGETSHWHRVDSTEIWLFHAGAPLLLSRAARTEGPATDALLGPDVLAGPYRRNDGSGVEQVLTAQGWVARTVDTR